MAGLSARPHNPYADDRRASSDSYRPRHDTHRPVDRPRDRDGVFRRESRDGPIRRESRDMRDGRDHRDPRDPREDTTRGGQEGAWRATSAPQAIDPHVESKAPSRLVKPVDPDAFVSKPPTTAKPEYQELFNTLWTWSDTLADRASVKAQLSKLHAEAGPRKAYNTKLEKADDGLSTALLRRTEIRQQEKETRNLKVKIQESDKSQQRELEQLIPKLIAVATQQIAPASSTSKEMGASTELERKFELMQARMEKQDEALAARDQKLREHEKRVDAWQKQSQDQQVATLKTIDALRLENENLKKQLTKQMREISESAGSIDNKTCAGHEEVRRELKRIDTDSSTKCKAIEVLCHQTAKESSQAAAKVTSRLSAVDVALAKNTQEHDGMAKQIQGLKDSLMNISDTINSCETEMAETTEKVDSLDLESLDKMINTWLDNRIPARVKEHDNEISSIRQEVAHMKTRMSGGNTSASTNAPSAADTVTRSLLGSTMDELYKKVLDTVAETSDLFGEELDGLKNDVQQLKEAKLTERIETLEQGASVESSAGSAATSELASRVDSLEGQRVPERMSELQSICMSRMQEFEKNVAELRSRVHEPTVQIMRQELRPVSEKLEGVAMQANFLDNQWKNVSTKDMARTILKELKDINNMTDSPGRQALESAEKLSRKLEAHLSEFTQTRQAHKIGLEFLQKQYKELNNLVDVVVRSGQRAGDKRFADGGVNGLHGHNDSKRMRMGNNTPSQGMSSPAVPQGPINGTHRPPH